MELGSGATKRHRQKKFRTQSSQGVASVLFHCAHSSHILQPRLFLVVLASLSFLAGHVCHVLIIPFDLLTAITIWLQPRFPICIMSSPNASLRHRGPQKDKVKVDGKLDKADDFLDQAIRSTKATVTSEWDFKLALGVITLLAFATRFWGISHPDEVVFDEVHFGKVIIS